MLPLCAYTTKRMTEKKINLQWCAMHFGTYMGIYWIAKFILFPTGLNHSTLLLLFIVLTIAVPFVGYRYARSFRDNVCGGTISFSRSWLFLFFMYLFAALLTAVAHYIYFRFFDNGLFSDTYIANIESLKAVPAFAEAMDQSSIEATIETIRSLTPIKMTMQWFTNNMFWGSILALITSLFVAKKK